MSPHGGPDLQSHGTGVYFCYINRVVCIWIPGLAAGICKQCGVRVSRRIASTRSFLPHRLVSSFPFYRESGWERERDRQNLFGNGVQSLNKFFFSTPATTTSSSSSLGVWCKHATIPERRLPVNRHRDPGKTEQWQL